MSSDDLSSLLQTLQGASGGKYLDFDTAMGGDDVSDVAPVQAGLELVLVNNASLLCRGKVGETKICLCLGAECDVKSHKLSAVPVTSFPGSRCLLVGSGPNLTKGYASPMLDATSLEPSMISDLLGRINEDWGKVFELVAVEGVIDLETEASLIDLSRTVKKKILGTPNTKRSAGDRVFDTCANDVKRAKTILKDGTQAQQVAKLVTDSHADAGVFDPDHMANYFKTIALRLDLAVGYTMGIGRLIDMLRDSIQGEVADIEDKIGGHKTTITMLEGAVGNRCNTVENCHPTLWGSIAEVSTTLQHHHELINGILKSLVKAKEQATSRSKNVGFSPSSGLTEPSSADGGLSPDPFFREGGFQASSQGATIQQGILNRRQEATSVAGGSSGGSSGGSGGSGPGSDGNGSGSFASGASSAQSVPGREDIRLGLEKLSDLEERVDRLESSQSGGKEDAVVLNDNIVLRCKQDVLGLLERFLGANCDIPAGAFASPHFLLNEVMTTLGCTLPNLDEFAKLKRLDVKAIDLRNSQALMAVLPLFFTSGKLSTHSYSGGNVGRFKAFPNAGEWGSKTNEDKLQYKCQKALTEVCSAVEEHIRDCFRGCPTLQLIAHDQLAACKRVVVECFDFLGDNYTRMMESFDSASDAWDLGCFSILQLFMNDFSVPLACMKFVDFSNARSTLLTAVWTNLRIGAIANEFNETGIQNHPATSSAQVRFIIQQAKSSRNSSQLKELATLKDQVKSLQDTVKKQEQLLTQHSGKLVQVESRADRACSALELPLDNKKRGKGKGKQGGGDGDE